MSTLLLALGLLSAATVLSGWLDRRLDWYLAEQEWFNEEFRKLLQEDKS
jgi:hypothetical protein